VGVPGVVVNGLAVTADGGVLAVGERDTSVRNQGPSAVVTELGADGTPGWTFTTGGPGGSVDAVAAGPSSFVVAVSNQEAGDVDPGPGTQILEGPLRFLSRFDF